MPDGSAPRAVDSSPEKTFNDHTRSRRETPYPIAVEQGKDYWWCACGKLSNQPFCDGSHKAEGDFKPVKYTADASKTVSFCGCKATGNEPMCDGSHKQTP